MILNINNWQGIHNTVPPRSIPDAALADAIDVDLDDAGILLQRRGYSQTVQLPISSAYSTQNQRGYVVSNGVLYELLPDLTLVNLAPSTATEFAEIGDVLFTNDGLMVDNRVVTDLKIPAPELPLELIVNSGGDFAAGDYSATYTYRRKNGLEGGSAPIATVTVPEGSAIAIVQPPALDGFEVTIYVTETNGTVFYDEQDVQLNPLKELANPFPAKADKIAFHGSKLFVSEVIDSGQTVVRFSKPFAMHLWDNLGGYFIVPGKVEAMLSTGGSLIIGTDRQILAYTDGGVQVLAEYGVVAGRSIDKLATGNILIHSKRGICAALPFQNLTEQKLFLPTGDQCSAKIVYQRGMAQFVVLHNNQGVPFDKYTPLPSRPLAPVNSGAGSA